MVDEENTVCANNGLSHQHLVFKSKEITLKTNDLASQESRQCKLNGALLIRHLSVPPYLRPGFPETSEAEFWGFADGEG